MKKNNSGSIKLSRILVTILLTLVLSVAFVACGGSKTMISVTWNASENANVSVSGYKSLPSSVEEGAELSVTISGKPGYVISSVKVNNRTVLGNDGVYVFAVGVDSTIDIETTKEISSVEVTTRPTKLTYYAGETLDATGMVVKVNYTLGDSEVITDYTIEYKSGTSFAVGDTAFNVRYNKVSSSDVTLTGAVECKVVINPSGGTISDGYYAKITANTALHNVNKAADGTISFTYSAITEDIALPVGNEITRGENDDYSFLGWHNGTAYVSAISATDTQSATLTAAYNAKLLTLNKVYYEITTEGEDRVPYLIIEGEFRAAQTAYLYLYEGNDNVELVGDTIGDETTQRGDAFKLKFDMRELVAKGYQGKWMDIKFRAQLGEIEEQMEINLTEYPDEGFVDLEQMIVMGDYSYSFKVYENTLKAVYEEYFNAQYTMTAGLDEDDNPTITFEGTIDETYAGKSVCIDWYLGSGTVEEKYCTIGEDGLWSITFVLDSRYTLTTDGYAHFKIVESPNDLTELYKDGSDGNLLNSNCINTNLERMSVGLIENSGALRCANADGSRTFYVGKGKWGGIVIYGRNEAIVMTNVTLESKNSTPYLVISGTYTTSNTAASVIEKLETDMYADWTNCNDLNQLGWTAYNLSLGNEAEGISATILVEAENGNWKVYLDLSMGQVGEALFAHYGSSTSNLVFENLVANSITVGTLSYTTSIFEGWSSKLVVVTISTAE